MEITAVKIEDKPYTTYQAPKEQPECIFYKGESCSPTHAKYKMCAKCHKFIGFTGGNAVPFLFNRIVALAGMLISVFGMGGGASGGGNSGGGGGGGR